MNIAEPFARQAAAAPDRPALVVGRESLTYGQLLSAVAGLAAGLRHLGVAPGDTVMTLVKARGANVALPLALASIGAKSVGVPSGVRPDRVKLLAQDTRPDVILHDRDADLALEHPGLRTQIRFAELVAAKGPASPFTIAQADPAEIWRVMVSSGSTGRHKGILCSHGASLAVALLQRAMFPTSGEDRMLIALHPGSGFATHYWLRALYSSACVIFSLQDDPAELLDLIHEQKITQFITSPGVAGVLAQHAMMPGRAHAGPSPALRIMNVGGAAVSPRLRAELRRLLCANLYINYGSTETGSIALLDPHLEQSHPDCAGRLVPWVEAQAVGEGGEPLPAGGTGALRFRGPGLASGYAGSAAPAGAANPFRGDWFYSNDVGSVTADGLVRLAGRTDEVLNLSGVKINAERLEAVLGQVPSVLECAVLTVPGPMDQPVLVAVVVGSDGFDAEELRQHCRARIGFGPTVVIRVKKLPRNEAGKIERKQLREKIRIQPDRAAPAPAPASD